MGSKRYDRFMISARAVNDIKCMQMTPGAVIGACVRQIVCRDS